MRRVRFLLAPRWWPCPSWSSRRAEGVEPVTESAPAPIEPEPVAYRRYVRPTNRPDAADPELAADNAYLAEPAEKDER